MNVSQYISRAYSAIFESSYPSEFTLEALSKFLRTNPSNASIEKWCSSHLGQKLGKGSSRIVFKLDETHVIKIALKDSRYGFEKGIAQNRVEADWGIQKWHSDVVTGISDQDEDFYWVVAEKAKTPITAARFKELTEIPFSKFAELLRYVIDTNKGMRYSKPADFDKYIDNEFLTEIISLAGNFGMPSGDLARRSHYGEVFDPEENDNDVKLIDYGLNNEVHKEFYGIKR